MSQAGMPAQDGCAPVSDDRHCMEGVVQCLFCLFASAACYMHCMEGVVQCLFCFFASAACYIATAVSSLYSVSLSSTPLTRVSVLWTLLTLLSLHNFSSFPPLLEWHLFLHLHSYSLYSLGELHKVTLLL